MSVMYHFVMDHDDRFPSLKTLKKNDFIGQLDYLLRHHIPLKADDLRRVATRQAQLPSNGFVLTFDHGTRDHIEIILPELLKRGIEGIFLIMTSVVVERKLPTIEKQRFLEGHFQDYKEFLKLFSERCIKCYPEKRDLFSVTEQTLFNAKTYLADFDFYSDEERLFRKIRDKHLHKNQLAQIIDDCFYEILGNEQDIVDKYYLSMDDLKELNESGMVVGSHGHHHINYNESGEQDCYVDLQESFTILRNELGDKGIDIASYPNGRYAPHLDKILADLGVQLCFTTRSGLNFSPEKKYSIDRLDTTKLPKCADDPIHQWSRRLIDQS
jgi:peptidoglycan/xylan/chitin deacetylase (PgdA/CDA1 family)